MKKCSSTSVFNNRGFTLIEILIAITLLAFITLGVVSVTQNAFDTKDRTTELNKNNLQIETAMSRFEWDFSQIYSPLYFSRPQPLNGADPYADQPIDTDGDGMDDNSKRPIADIQAAAAATAASPEMQEYYQRLQARFEGNENFSGINVDGMPIPRFYSPEKNIFMFFTSSNRRKMENTKQSHFGWVRYQLADAEPNQDEDLEKNPNIPPSLKNLVRYFNPDDPYNDKRMDPINGFSATQVKGAVLLKNVESLEFLFWDYNRKKWENSLRAIQQGESIIRGVKMIVVHYDSFGNKRTSERSFRNHWPMVAPMDTPTTVPSTAPDASPSATTGTTPGGSIPDTTVPPEADDDGN